ncbi:fumarylacetoacetate hydrolase family protein [Flavisolibacter ginsengisoli]|jgi:2-keto-4-pentenoate hydratase/2-oxohepta-3-ene-1,7-dioic acid hydratase in catechol pathway|uniref:2-keto-4-pentenoate hydratase/2-oxohepta-3-ene-1,7-dioic acid hydratase (Catechol pathway) n=1 Tax=Flavisolibacter ginsengisoli DSM 18119 TaxID=1121884 RepID=A0A1M5G7E7_9BACT|nr:fumarylacetoacetate hydrolase family protein [Flavisolibacter ginsengisoli]SHF99697.1 2-keto-4-pentenoate hydratase/2-oxohepta-3-ene-1,7-dioic acid hydratase (catechol pathway) [Flavisolibacter ginsengisoli DSM 18119]
MKILYYRKENKLYPGIVTNEGVLDITDYLKAKHADWRPEDPLTLEDVAEIKKQVANGIKEPAKLLREHSLSIGPCVPHPSKIICIGLNYRRHAIESGMAVPTVPVVFTKYSNTLTDYGHDVPLGPVGVEFDYEVELGVVIGKKCKHVRREEALDNVLGYCVANDLSCRDLQFMSSQWLMGKSLDAFLPLGKYLVTADEVGDPQSLQLTCSLNGEQRQNSNTVDMVFTVAEIIAFLTEYMTLEPGDLILTGTPEGVIMGMPRKEWMKPGDVVRVEIEKLGYTENKMV